VLDTFTIITTTPNALLRPIHNRMPVIYDKEMGEQWLDPLFSGSPTFLAAVLQPLPDELMETQDVSTLINSPANESPDCIWPV
jgi:putative SOS response-associated peptidase YedK